MPKGFRRVRLSRGWPDLPDAAAEFPVIIPKRNEALPEYFIRVAVATKLSTVVVEKRWLNPDVD